jgi:hypothetical protein
MEHVRRDTLAVVVVALVMAAVACSSQTPNRGSCTNHSYLSGGVHTVACPGTDTCSCAAPSACCMGNVGANTGECVAPETCGSFLLTCDGQEDCGSGVCCFTITAGSTCSTASQCQGSWLCRSDADCAGSPAGPTCSPADFGVIGVKDRGIDKLVGTCGQ